MYKCISYKCLNKYDLPNNPYDQFGPNCCCDLIKPYCCNYYCNCCLIVPTGMMPSIPPLPPMPPMPPPPPGRQIIGEGIFTSRPNAIIRGRNSLTFIFTTSMIQGMGMAHNDGDTEIFLIPNTTYNYSYRLIVTQLDATPNMLESFLQLSNVPVAGSMYSKNIMNPGFMTFIKSGSFTTDDNPNQVLQLIISTNRPAPFESDNSTLMLEALL